MHRLVGFLAVADFENYQLQSTLMKMSSQSTVVIGSIG